MTHAAIIAVTVSCGARLFATATSPGATEEIATWAMVAQPPPDILHLSRRFLINVLGTALGAVETPQASITYSQLARQHSDPQCTVAGRLQRLSCRDAAFANGYAMHLEDFDDTHFPTELHPSAPCVPAALAEAEWNNHSVAELLTAIAVGTEVECRIALASYPWPADQGFHTTGVVGVFGAVVAASRLRHLRPEHARTALGFAASQSAGLSVVFGTDAKAFHPARAAQSGVVGAELAGAGLTAPRDILENPRGWFHVFSQGKANWTALLAGLGEHWELRQVGLKAFSNGIVVQPLEEAVIALRNEYGLKQAEVESIHGTGNERIAQEMGRYPVPSTPLEGKFSFQYCIAVAFLDGAAGPPQFDTSRILRPDVQALVHRVTCACNRTEGEMPIQSGQITITLKNGTMVSKEVKHVTGTPNTPLSDTALEAKFLGLVATRLGADKAKRLLALLWRMESHQDLMEALGHLREEPLQRRVLFS